MDYVTPEEMREAEGRAASYGLDAAALMENAGAAVVRVVEERFAQLKGGRILVVCGLGNNGGDGFVAARLFSRAWKVRVLLLGPASEIKTDEAAKNWRRLGAHIEKAEARDEASVIGHHEWFERAGIVLDAVLGTGVKGDVRQPMAAAIHMINSSRAVKVAVDIPSGLDPLSGEAGPATVRADLTVTLHRAKTGLRGKDEYTGEVLAVPIGIRE